MIANFMRSSFTNTLQLLMTTFPKRLTEVNVQASFASGELLESLTDACKTNKVLQALNVAGIPLSNMFCANVRALLIQSDSFRNLDISNCKIQAQATRSILQGINRNYSLQYFNFQGNSMHSSIYEFSIMLAKIICRHPRLMHIDVSCAALKKQEVIFVGMALRQAKACVGIHLSANNLDYYERIFLRTLTNARVNAHFRNMAQEQGSVRSQKERFQIQELKNHSFDNKDLQEFVQVWNYIDSQRLGLDDDINELLKTIDITDLFRQLRKGQRAKVENNELLKGLVRKI